jgi:hypothetical protein
MSGRRRDGRGDIGPSVRDKENDVRSLMRFLIMVFLSMGVWIAIGLGVGFLLHRFIPTIDLGMATLIRGGNAWRLLSVAQPDFDPGGSLWTRRQRTA